MKQAASSHPIELKITDLHQLFNSMDPSPFHERDLDHDAEEFIVSWARESPKDAPIHLIVHLAKPAEIPDPQSLVASSLRHYFDYRAEITLRELKQLLRQGRASLIIGLAFLVACNLAATLFAPGPGTWHGLAREGLAHPRLGRDVASARSPALPLVAGPPPQAPLPTPRPRRSDGEGRTLRPGTDTIPEPY